MIFGSIWSVGAEGFRNNPAAVAMIHITFYAIGATLLISVTSLIGPRAKLAGWVLTTLGGIACLIEFVGVAVMLVNKVGNVLGI